MAEPEQDDTYNVGGIRLSKEDLAEAYRAFQRFDKDGSGAIDTKVTKVEINTVKNIHFFAPYVFST